MFEKIMTLIWFLKRPLFWRHLLQLIKRKFMTNYDTTLLREKAEEWAKEHVVPYKEALLNLGLNGEILPMSESLLSEGQALALESRVAMGGPGDLNLLFNAVRLLQADKVIETGVAYGWSSLAILHAMSLNEKGKLYSVDMPYVKKGNEAFVGIVVPNNLKDRWVLLREPDNCGLEKLLDLTKGNLDLCHYDSDKSWWGRAYAFPLLWNALKPGGLFISDDIQDNLFFSNFVKVKKLNFAVTKSSGKYVGLIRKDK